VYTILFVFLKNTGNKNPALKSNLQRLKALIKFVAEATLTVLNLQKQHTNNHHKEAFVGNVGGKRSS